MENFAKETLIAIKEYYMQDNADKESIELVKNIAMYLYETTTDSNMQHELLNYAWDNKFCINCGEQLQFYGEASEDNIEFWDCPCSREV